MYTNSVLHCNKRLPFILERNHYMSVFYIATFYPYEGTLQIFDGVLTHLCDATV